MTEKVTRLASNWRTWAVIGGLIILWMVYRNGKRWAQQITTALGRRDEGNYAGQEPVASNPVREAELTKLAEDTYTALNSILFFGGVTATGREWQLEKVYTLNDTELRWLANRYKILANGVSLREDLEHEYMPFTDVDERLIARLQQLAL